MAKKTEEILAYLASAFPEAKCSLVFASPYQCLVAVSLSAQTTDESVNKVTPRLFLDYPTPKELGSASLSDIEDHIRSLGLYRNKAKNLKALGQALEERFGGVVPSTREELTTLPGVGIKTANVVTAECFEIQGLAVDTHAGRVSKRLGLAKEADTPEQVEGKLEKFFPRASWLDVHHRLIAFGRAICHAKSPECGACGLQGLCPYFKKYPVATGK